VAGLARPAGNGRTAALSASVHGGGPGNPLGARALYLGHSVFRIHGTNQPETIGHAVSSGCFRLDNADVIDLYDRVQVGAKVLVRQSAHVS
jgi:lipoprotein-anchoring transpeptidase ErfK/SrfK